MPFWAGCRYGIESHTPCHLPKGLPMLDDPLDQPDDSEGYFLALDAADVEVIRAAYFAIAESVETSAASVLLKMGTARIARDDEAEDFEHGGKRFISGERIFLCEPDAIVDLFAEAVRSLGPRFLIEVLKEVGIDWTIVDLN